MRFGLLTSRGLDRWHNLQLVKAMRKRGIEPFIFSFGEVVARVGYRPAVEVRGQPLEGLDAVVVRPVGRGSLEEIVFRMDMLYRLHDLGVVVVNHPQAIEICVDKYRALFLMEQAGIPVPKTYVTESVNEALKLLEELGGKCVVKPIFGSQGRGMVLVEDREVAWRVFNALSYTHHVIYVQEFVPHGQRDIRALVVGDKVVASMYRVSSGDWRTNIAQGGKPVPCKLPPELEEVAVKAARITRCEVAGVDILETRDGRYLVSEVNSAPGWRGLQRVTGVNIADVIVSHVASLVKR